MESLVQRARAAGIETDYLDADGERVESSPEAVEAVLSAVLRGSGPPAPLPPVTLAWDGRLDPPDLPGRGFVETEDGAAVELPLSGPLPLGYHRLVVEDAGKRSVSTLIAAPQAAWRGDEGRAFGLFLPLYALRTDRSGGTGSLSDLHRFARFTRRHGGRFVATLPLYPTFVERDQVGPYAPITRRAFNELFVAPQQAEAPAGLRQGRQVPYREHAAWIHGVLKEESRAFFDCGAGDAADFRAFLAERPWLVDYAHFRGDERLHLYAQYRAEGQLAELAADGDAASLSLDLPLGADADGFDVVEQPLLYAEGVTVGCPPDAIFRWGQDWGFPPLHPDALRRAGLAPFIEAVRHAMRHADRLRIDHVMGLHRLYWIPEGGSADEGVYVRYPADELYAVLCLESHRQRCRLIGEDLGIVPDEVRPALKRRGLARTRVLQVELPDPPADEARAMASLNTHDMPTFAGYCAGDDLKLLEQLGLADAGTLETLAAERREQQAALVSWAGDAGDATGSLLDAALRRLADGESDDVTMAVEDLWLETEPHNVPGSWNERPNWRRRARYALDEWGSLPGVVDRLRRMGRSR